MPITFERHFSYNINKELNLMVSYAGYIEYSPKPILDNFQNIINRK